MFRCGRALPSVLVVLGLFAVSGCDGSSCHSACSKLAKCAGADTEAGIVYRGATATSDATTKPGSGTGSAKGFACSLSEECSSHERCQAKCISQASCDALSGKDAEGAAKLRACQEKCATASTEAGTMPVRHDGTEGNSDARRISDARRVSDGGPKCARDCADRECGDDGCGGSCGICVLPSVCGDNGICKSSCTPSCSGKQCGSDGCGGSCGTCSYGKTCSNGTCISTCTPYCSGKECGSDGCGGSCGTCSYGKTCSNGTCISTCTPTCSGKQCGSDGCGGSCGTCPSGYTCNAGTCQYGGTTGCGNVTEEGCCSGTTLKYCASGQLSVVSCSANPSCGWTTSGYYDCGTSGGSDPSGVHPRTCY